MHTLSLGILIVGGSIFLAQLGLRAVRRSVPLPHLQNNHEVAGFILGIIGAVYAVLLGFMVIIVWNQYQDAQANVSSEANQLTDLAQMSKNLPAPVQAQARQQLQTYIQIAIDDEWPAMSHGQASPSTQAALDELWKSFLEMEPQTAREQTLFAQSIEKLEALGESRNDRLHASRNDVPSLIWCLFVVGGVITVAFTYFFGAMSMKAQSLMTISLVGMIAFILFLVVALDNPFRGDVRISPEPLRNALERIRTI